MYTYIYIHIQTHIHLCICIHLQTHAHHVLESSEGARRCGRGGTEAGNKELMSAERLGRVHVHGTFEDLRHSGARKAVSHHFARHVL